MHRKRKCSVIVTYDGETSSKWVNYRRTCNSQVYFFLVFKTAPYQQKKNIKQLNMVSRKKTDKKESFYSCSAYLSNNIYHSRTRVCRFSFSSSILNSYQYR
jgi:hypothetical protein